MPQTEQAPTSSKAGRRTMAKAFWNILIKLIIPALIITLFLNRYFVQGLTMGSAKG